MFWSEKWPLPSGTLDSSHPIPVTFACKHKKQIDNIRNVKGIIYIKRSACSTLLSLRVDNQCCNVTVMKELIIKYKGLYTGSPSYSMKNNCKIYTINDEFMQVISSQALLTTGWYRPHEIILAEITNLCLFIQIVPQTLSWHKNLD